MPISGFESTDATADSVHVFAGLPPTVTDAQVVAMVTEGKGRFDRVDRALFKGTVRANGSGPHALTIVALEPTGTRNIQRVSAVVR